MKIWRKKSLTT